MKLNLPDRGCGLGQYRFSMFASHYFAQLKRPQLYILFNIFDEQNHMYVLKLEELTCVRQQVRTVTVDDLDIRRTQ